MSTNSTRTEEEPLKRFQQQLEARLHQAARLAANGVTIVDPATTYIDAHVEVGSGSVIKPNTTITGKSHIGANCQVGPNTVIEDSTLMDDVQVGPFCHIRGGAHIESGVHLGNYVEVKASRIGAGSKAHHFSYIGDADVGRDVNIGAGTVTCNYDGESKHRTVIEDGAFIGSDTMLVAPVRVGKGAGTAAGSVVTTDVEPGDRVAGIPAKPMKKGPNG
ncbi:MAG TPA: DapH/DapD/GlmU-related protein [Dehalococcoidia bacterium]|nr:DapH/DapD/GlmU-related protein [Dehalococcoidia bacterium]